jgi:prepilin-type N-terminal cleavage/methylation domain-containing protein
MKHSVQAITGRRGFTLIELMTTVAIIAVLASILIAALGYAKTVSNRNKTAAHVRVIKTGLEGYKKDYGTFPVPRTPGGAPVDVGGIQWEGMGAKMLYQALSGDGEDTILGGTGSPSTGQQKSTPGAKIYWEGADAENNQQRAVFALDGSFYLVDGWGVPWQFAIPDPQAQLDVQSLRAQYRNAGTYDLWSYGGNKEDFQNQAKWIKNW